MKLPTYQFVAQMCAAIAVVGSLGLVAYELKQSRDMAVAELMLTTYMEEKDIFLAVADIDAYNSAVH